MYQLTDLSFRFAFVLAVAQIVVSGSVSAQRTSDSGAVPAPAWRDSARYGGGPSVGPPPSDFMGAKPPDTWCLRANGRASGDLGGNWTTTSRGWLRQILSDTTDFGDGWRKVLGGAPRLAPSDSIVQIEDEAVCRDVAQVLNRDLLGWKVGPPPVVIFRVRDYLIAYPSNARMGEFGFAVGMSSKKEIRAVSTW
jgi:hypothetical protein